MPRDNVEREAFPRWKAFLRTRRGCLTYGTVLMGTALAIITANMIAEADPLPTPIFLGLMGLCYVMGWVWGSIFWVFFWRSYVEELNRRLGNG